MNQPEHVDNLPIWECPCTECLHLDYEASDDGSGSIEPFARWAAIERPNRIADLAE